MYRGRSRRLLAFQAVLAFSLLLITGLAQAQETASAPAVMGAAPVVPALSHLAAGETDDAATWGPADALATPETVYMASAPDAMPDATADFEEDVIALINVERSEKGCPALVEHTILREVAFAHSVDMVERNFFGHTNPDGEDPSERMREAGYIPVTWAENIAAGQATPQEVVAVWLSSEAHRRNTLNCDYLDVGVGYFYTPGVDYWHYWTLDLGRQEQTSAAPTAMPTRNPRLTPAAFLPVTVE